jgi:hypothetical protein
MGPDELAKLVECPLNPFEVKGNLGAILFEIFT